MKSLAEFVERPGPVRLLPDDHVSLEPDQFSLIVEVHAAPLGRPRRRRVVQELRRDRRVNKRPPGPTRITIQIARDARKVFAILFCCPQPASRRQYVAQVFGEALVDPKQLAFHWLLITWRRKPRRTPVLSVPRMHKLVRQQPGAVFPQGRIDQRALGDSIVARLVVFESEMRNVVAQRVKEMIVLIVTRSEKRFGLGDQTLVVSDVVRAHHERLGAVTHHINLEGRTLAFR